MLTITPFDKGTMKDIERAILESDLGLTPANDGQLIRLPIPQLTEERRKDLVKQVRHMAEEGRVAARNIRRDAIHQLKELEKNGDDGLRRRAPRRGPAAEADRRARRARSTRRSRPKRPRSWKSDRRSCAGSGRRAASARLLRSIGRRRAAPERPARRSPRATWPSSWTATAAGRSRRGLPPLAGHRAGTKALRRTVEAAPDLGVRSLAVYAFSTENWGRPETRGGRSDGALRGDDPRAVPRPAPPGRARALRRPPRPLSRSLRRADGRHGDAHTGENTRLDLWVAFDYGARAEIVPPRAGWWRTGVAAEAIDEEAVAPVLYAPEMPDPDLVIRTSGELRMSNFLLWQSAYAEFALHPDALAGLRRGRSARGAGGLRRPPAKIRASVSALVSRVADCGSAADRSRCTRAYVGGWVMTAVAVVTAVIALHELYGMTRHLRPLIPAGIAGDPDPDRDSPRRLGLGDRAAVPGAPRSPSGSRRWRMCASTRWCSCR